MKKVLIITYHYPPSLVSGAVRPSKFVRYLPQFGWEPCVLTASAPGESANGTVHCVRAWPHPLKSYESYKARRAKDVGKQFELLMKWNPVHAHAMATPREKIAGFKTTLFAFLRLPDEEAGWIFPAIWKGFRLIRKRRLGHVITTGPPFSCHLVGLALKRLTGVRWVADFRDPWSLDHKFAPHRSGPSDFVEARFIRSVMRHADLVVSVTPQMTEHVKKEHPELTPEKFVTLSNGFDPEDFSKLTFRTRASGPVLFSYVGAFYYGRTPEPFLRALKSGIDEGMLEPRDIRVRFVGNVAVAEGQVVSEMIRQLGLEEMVSVHPPVSRDEALRQTVESDVLLVLDEMHPIQIPLKLYEGLAAGPVILNIGSRGAVSEVLARTGKGLAVDHAKVSEIRDGILQSIRRSRSRETQNGKAPWLDPKIQEFNFLNVSRQLASLLEGLGAKS